MLGELAMQWHQRRVREIDRFPATDDDGQTYTVIEYQWFTTLISDHGPVATTASKELRLSDDKDVVTMSAVPKTLKTIETDKLIRKVR
jgi:hypothetical protein